MIILILIIKNISYTCMLMQKIFVSYLVLQFCDEYFNAVGNLMCALPHKHPVHVYIVRFIPFLCSLSWSSFLLTHYKVPGEISRNC